MGEYDFFVYGDYIEENMQGGSALARRAIRKVFDAQAGFGEPTALTQLFLKAAKETAVDQLLYRYMMEDGFADNLRFLVPEILKTAEEGDPVTCQLVREYASRMGEYILAGTVRMKSKEGKRTVVLAGSVWKGSNNMLTSQVKAYVREHAGEVTVLLADADPVTGACRMAKKYLEKGEAL